MVVLVVLVVVVVGFCTVVVLRVGFAVVDWSPAGKNFLLQI